MYYMYVSVYVEAWLRCVYMYVYVMYYSFHALQRLYAVLGQMTKRGEMTDGKPPLSPLRA